MFSCFLFFLVAVATTDCFLSFLLLVFFFLIYNIIYQVFYRCFSESHDRNICTYHICKYQHKTGLFLANRSFLSCFLLLLNFMILPVLCIMVHGRLLWSSFSVLASLAILTKIHVIPVACCTRNNAILYV